jgi:predicted dienelactone hydrolase
MKMAMMAITSLVIATAPATAAGFQRVTVPDPGDQPLEVGLWYPSDAPASPQPLGSFSQTVAVDGPVAGSRLPLVVISHGTGGSFSEHYDTALALAEAGFVVAAVTHTGDNYRDQSKMAQVADRPRHVSRLLDYMFAAWPARDQLDPARVGMFGFSSGGFTALVSIGGVPDMTRVGPYCAEHRQDFACRVTRERHIDVPAPPPATAWVHDARIKAAVVAAPALSFTFTPTGLSAVSVPVQLWRAEEDEILPHPNYAQAVYEALPTKPDYHVVPNAGHFAFVPPCSEALAQRAPDICRDAPDFDRAAFHEKFNAAVVAFFKARLPRG